MGFFSKKIKKDEIVNSLVATFAVSRDSLLKGVIESVEDGTEMSNEQDHEIMILALLSNIHPYKITFGDSPTGGYIIGKFQDAVFNMYLFSEREREDFKEKFWTRCKEYYEVYKPDNEDMAIQIGQIFCTHFFGKKEDGSHAGMMFVIGAIFLKIQIEVKKTLDEILSKYEVV
jgi:hypothetical protein